MSVHEQNSRHGRAAARLSAAMDSALARQILEAAPTIIYVYDVIAQRSIFQNRSLSTLLGQPQTQPGDDRTDWQRFIHPDDAATFPAHRERLSTIKPGEALTWEFRLQDAGGDWRHFASRDVLLDSTTDGRPWRIVGSAADVTQQKRAEEHQILMLQEMRHRTKNLFAVLEAIGRQGLPKNHPPTVEFFSIYVGRLRALLGAGEITIGTADRRADLRSVADLALVPFLGEAEHRVTVAGPPVLLPETAALGLALALHELATNAMKYGALSTPDGRLALEWSFVPEGDMNRLVLEWKERGGPRVTPPETRSFGMRLIKTSTANEPGSRIDLDFAAEGLTCRFSFLVTN
jgi:two-component sensor histidine kinase